MKRSILYYQAVAVALGLVTFDAYAASSDATGRGWIPYTTAGYVGLNLGTAQQRAPCIAPFGCKNPPLAGKIYTGGMFSSNLGLELGYVNAGVAQRNGGQLKAQGINLSLVGQLPIVPKINALLKVGGTYGWTDTTVAASLINEPRGKKHGGALSYGAGLAFDISPKNQLLIEWDRQHFQYVSGNHGTDLYSLGWKYKF